jgi:pimeloyl-ACP methyl ester carboxylesterase
VIARTLSVALRGAADTYEVGEGMISGWAGGLGAAAGGLTLTSASVGRRHPAGESAGTGLGAGEDLRSWLMSPEGVAGVRRTVSRSDEALLAGLGIPVPVAQLLGDEGLGLVGLGTVATVVGSAGAALGLVRETPVTVAPRRTGPGDPVPTGFTERLDRIPSPETEGGQIRVDVYERPDGTRYAEVFIAGTQEFNPLATDEPFDMASNLGNTVGDSSAAVRSVEQALALSGVDESTPVVVTAHSQGGAVAARLAESGHFDIAGIVTFGAPTGQIPIPESIPTVLVEHLDDPVPAFGGDQDNAHAVRVERRAFAPGDLPAEGALPTHDLTAYRTTALGMDAGGGPALTDAVRRLDGLTRGGVPVSSTIYDAERVTGVAGSVSVTTSPRRPGGA